MKILSYNICEGGVGRQPAILDVIREQQPDAVALLEVDRQATAELMGRELGMHVVFGEANCAAHIAWLSRLPIVQSFNHRHAGLAKTLLEIVVAWQGESVHLFATHLASRHEPPEPVEEIPIIIHQMTTRSAHPHLLVGDFNALRPGDPVGQPPAGVIKRGDAIDGAARLAIAQLLDAGYVDCFRALHPRVPGHTYPAIEPWLRLDYIFAAPTMASRLSDCGIVSTMDAMQASDHLPIWAEFH